MSKIHTELEEVKQRKVTFEGDEFKFTTGEKRTRCRKVFLVAKMSGKKTGKPGEEQIKRMKEKVNDLLRVEKGVDGVRPFARVAEVKNEGASGDPNESRWLLECVHTDEERVRIRKVMGTQLAAVCEVEGVKLGHHFTNEMNPNSVVMVIPEGLGEGPELSDRIKAGNPDIQLTPRWPEKVKNTKTKWRVEVRTTTEARRLVQQGIVKVGDKTCPVELFREGPRDAMSPKGVPKGPKYGTTTSAPQQRIGTFAAVAEASKNCEEGWREVPDRRKTPKIQGWG